MANGLLFLVLFFEFEELFDHLVGFYLQVVVKMFLNLLVEFVVLAVQSEIALHRGWVTWYFLRELADSFDTSKNEGDS